MAGYATLDDVQARMPQFPLSATSKPTVEVAQTFLNDVHAEVNSALRNLGYVVPITGAEALAQVRTLESHGVIALILYARAAAVGGEASLTSADRHQKLYDKTLEDWKSARSPKELADAARTSDAMSKPDTTLNGLLTDDDGYDIEPRVTMSQQF